MFCNYFLSASSVTHKTEFLIKPKPLYIFPLETIGRLPMSRPIHFFHIVNFVVYLCLFFF